MYAKTDKIQLTNQQLPPVSENSLKLVNVISKREESIKWLAAKVGMHDKAVKPIRNIRDCVFGVMGSSNI